MDRHLQIKSSILERVEAGVTDILQAQERAVADVRALRNEAPHGKLAESATMIRYELDHKRSELPARHIANLERVYNEIVRVAHPLTPTFSNWFISPNDIDYDVKTPFARGGFGQVHHGTWTGGAEVVIKVLLVDDENSRKMFKKELEIWYSLDHPHINRLYGACDLASPPFFVSEEAKNGDFVYYFREFGRAEIWRLFYEAALGLNYLHKNKVIHGDLKCSNLLVGSDDKAKICDFGFSFARTASVGMSAIAQADEIRYKAPETMIQMDNPDDFNPRMASDVYSFGLCIWEAFEGEVPFRTLRDDEITEKLFDETFEFPAPKNLPVEQWDFVRRMLHHNWKQRVSLPVVIEMLCGYRFEKSACNTYPTNVPWENLALQLEDKPATCTCSRCCTKWSVEFKFCGGCGHKLVKTAVTAVSTPLKLISHADVEFNANDTIIQDTKSTLQRGTWCGHEVVVKHLLTSASDTATRTACTKQAAIWQNLDHPNIVKMHGVCLVGNQPFFVIEPAANGNFEDYFRKDKSQIWRLFYEVALGLDYMHQHDIVHGNLNCRRLLVDVEINAKISGIHYAFNMSSVTTQPITRSDMIRWRAPELLARPGEFASLRIPVPASDVYSFGMCIWEAFAGHPPFDVEDYDTILEKVLDENITMPCPENMSDVQWNVVLRMLDRNWRTRLRLQDVIAVLEKFKSEPPPLHLGLNAEGDNLNCASISGGVSANVIQSELGGLYISQDEVQLVERFASGSFGKIYIGKWNMDTVVIKCVNITSLSDKQAFLREINVWSKLRHRHIVQFYGACDVGSQCFIVCELATEGTLTDYLRREREAKSCNVWRKLHDAALGLFFLHKNNIVHGDLKGNNILVRKDGEVILADFGLSFVESKTKPNVSNLGAIRWRAPEYVIHGIDGLSRAADVYSLGMCIIEAVTGILPWGSIPESAVSYHLRNGWPMKKIAGISDEAWQLISDMCTHEPSDRLSLSKVLQILDEFAIAEEDCINKRVNNDNRATA